MRDPLAQPLFIVDLETTGADPTRDRITEIAALRLESGVVVERWESLVDPQRAIPPEITALTGISNDMVRGAPTFRSLIPRFLSLAQGAIFVAHNARFDYGFIKNELMRAEQAFTADVLCTVRLSRRLAPQHPSHSLDSLIARFGLHTEHRHRAMGDTELVLQLLARLKETFGEQAISVAARHILKIPSLPSQLPADALDTIPDCHGVYSFYGVNRQALYIGKANNLRERIRSHFSSDYRTANDARLASELQHIEWFPTAGEFGALLLETVKIRQALPLHNKAKRKKEKLAVIAFADLNECPKVIGLETLDADQFAGHFGPFVNNASARRALQSLASEHQLCWTTLGLEHRDGACFARQVRKCAGCCVGAEPLLQHQMRVLQALAHAKIPAWPFNGPAVLLEFAPLERVKGQPEQQAFYFDQWRLVGVDDVNLLVNPNAAEFDLSIFKLLLKHLHKLKPIATF